MAQDIFRETRAAHDATLTVFYDGACPLCRREISFYKRRNGAERIAWCDVSQAKPGSLPSGLDQASALARFHVQTGEGELKDGGDAFRALWRALPLFRPIALVLGLPGLRSLLNMAYDRFLVFRPRLQRLTARSCRA